MKLKKIHMIGIGGAGMSALARYLIMQGNIVTGSDCQVNDYTRLLESLGARVSIGHKEQNIDSDTNVVVHSASITEENVELQKGKKLGAEIFKYSQYLGKLSCKKETVAVCGTHGKTTTTAMIAYILTRAGFEPSFICGSNLLQLNSNSAFAKGRYFICEACEYDRSFMNLSPKYACVTNIEEDHLDYYKDINAIVQAFGEFLSKIPQDGMIFGFIDHPNVASLVSGFKNITETVSLAQDAHWRARNITVKEGIWHFEVIRYGKLLDEFKIELIGIHNVANALLAIACSSKLGVGKEIIQLALSEFKGTKRRMENLGNKQGTIVIDDYAHHPSEIEATLKSLRERYAGKNIWCVFQPHQYSRTRLLIKQFAKSFTAADVVLVLDIFQARDSKEEKSRVSSEDLVQLINANSKPALYMPTFDEAVDFLLKKVDKDSVLVTMGAGNVDEVAKRFLIS